MGRIKHIFFALAFFYASQSFADGDTALHLQQTKFIAANFTDFYADNLGNIYCITPDNQVKKINTNGDSLAVFNDVKQYGKIFSIDVTNPLKILVYYKDFSSILILDRFLNTIAVIDLRQSNILEARAVAGSYDGNIWVFDELDAKIKKLDYNGNILLQSADFRLLFSDNFSPSKIIDNNSGLFLYDPKQGWKMFDYYGGFKKNILYTDWKDVQVSDNILSGRDSTTIFYAQTSSWQFSKAVPDISLSNVIKTQFRVNQFFTLTKEGIFIYSILQH
jgi:hypothetical protein